MAPRRGPSSPSPDAARLLPPGAVEEFAEAAGGRFRVLRSTASGTGTPLLLIHGGGPDNAAISWYRAFAPLSVDRPVFAADLAGCGYTEDVPVTGTAAGMADQLAELADALGLGRMAVAGVSMGGEVALQFALRHPGRCAALVAVAPGGLVERLQGRYAQRAAWLATLLPDPVLRPLAALANRFVGAAVKRMVHDPSTLPAEVVAEMVREARRPGSGMAYGAYNKASIGPRGMLNNLLPEVGRITVPTLFFHGAADPLVPPSGSAGAAARIPGARLVLVPDCGHWAQLEAHGAFVDEVRGFLAG
ncbi:alpha/beta fold hydrolase [Zafaria sp. J156]|uniref:alpha/beta fold hydrolase n=1 Tax=Zafaria sp. J156 TaxID=3116490 RepID=UPI002E7837D8|nr:alpha/beta fold hydrolase [Zafaria sp. J156]MEE1622378.1 alpha/beta fold hydrolase [Zafaria sp. J156]